MTRGRILIGNTLANAASSLFGQVMAFVTLPLLLKQVGLDHFGIYALATSAMGYFSVFSLMARASVVKYLSEYRAGRENEAQSLFSGAILLNAGMGIMIGAVFFLLARYCEEIFRIPSVSLPQAKSLLILHGAATILLQPLTVFASVLYGLQRYGIISFLDGLWTLVRTAVILGIYFFEGTIFWLAWEEILCQFLKLGILAYITRRDYPFLRFNPRVVHMQDLRKIALYGGWSLLYTVSLLVVYQGSMLLTGILISVAAIAYFQIAYKLYNLILTVSLFLNSAALPASSSALAGGDVEFVSRLAVSGTRMNLMVLLVLASSILLFADDIIRFWLGADYVEGASPVSRVLIASWFFTAHSTLLTQVYWAQKKISSLSAAVFGGAIAQVLLTLALAKEFGLFGVAASNAAFYAYVSIASLWNATKVLGISPLPFLKETVIPACMGILIYPAAVLLALRFAGPPVSLLQLLIYLSVFFVLGMGASLTIVGRKEFLALMKMRPKLLYRAH